MNTDQLQEFMERELGPVFLGVFASSELPESVPRPAGLIANLDPKTKPGSHWVAFWFDDEGQGEYFCSYGKSPKGVMYDFLVKNSPISACWSSLRLQGPASATCGQYCAYYLCMKNQGVSTMDILNSFTKDGVKNDCLIADWMDERFDSSTVCHPWPYIQSCSPLV